MVGSALGAGDNQQGLQKVTRVRETPWRESVLKHERVQADSV